MTVCKEALSTHRFIGLSTDEKPTPVPCGSTFFEYDTQSMYICYDGVSWTVKDDSITILKAIQAAVES
jgi:hypothetical protein